MGRAFVEYDDLSVEARSPTGSWFTIAEDVFLSVRKGEVLALIGESGAGKTTVGLAALGYAKRGTRFRSGEVRVGGANLLAMDIEELRDIRGRRVSYVAQGSAAALNPSISIVRQVAEPLLLHGLSKSEADAMKRAVELLAQLDLPEPAKLAQRYPHQISGGQQQRAVIAMALICDPDVLVFDEPTTALDVTVQVGVLKTIKKVIEIKDAAAIFVSHDLAVVAQVADHIAVMRYGKVVEQGKTSRILSSPEHEYTKLLLDAARADGLKGADERSDFRSLLLEVDGLRASYVKTRAWRPLRDEDLVLRDVSLTVNRGEIVALVGESGSGKTTLARVVAGLHDPVAGSVRFEGDPLVWPISRRSTYHLKKMQIAFQSPELSLNPRQRVGSAIERPLSQYFDLNARKRRKRVAELLEMVELDSEFANRFPGELSGGERQRVALARSLAAKPDLLICDEILSSLDTVVAAKMLRLLKKLQKEYDLSYLFISHDLAKVASIADRVIVLYGGQVCEEGDSREIFSPPYHPYTNHLLSSVPQIRTDWLKDTQTTVEENAALQPTKIRYGACCPYSLRCNYVIEGICDSIPPPKKQLDNATIFCHLDIANLPADANEIAEEFISRRREISKGQG